MADSIQGYPPPERDSSGVKTAVLVGAVVAMLGANIYLYTQVDVLKSEISKLRGTGVAHHPRGRNSFQAGSKA